MAWIVQSMTEGPLCITDVGITMTKGQLRDLDLIGRDNAERSNDIKVLLLKGFLRTVRKDASPSISSADPKIIEQLKEAAEMANKANQQLETANANNAALQQQLAEQKKKTEEAVDISKKVLEELRAFAEHDPLGIRTIKKALENIQAEKGQVVKEIAESRKAPEPVSDRELKTHEQILRAKERKLEKNFKELGKTVSKSAEDIDDLVDAMDEEGIF